MQPSIKKEDLAWAIDKQFLFVSIIYNIHSVTFAAADFLILQYQLVYHMIATYVHL